MFAPGRYHVASLQFHGWASLVATVQSGLLCVVHRAPVVSSGERLPLRSRLLVGPYKVPVAPLGLGMCCAALKTRAIIDMQVGESNDSSWARHKS